MTLANATANVAVNDTLYTLNKGRFEVGKIGENDLLKSELALLRARAAVDDAKLARDRAEAALRRMIDYPGGPAAHDRDARLDSDRRRRSGPRRQARRSRTRALMEQTSSTTCNARRGDHRREVEQPASTRRCRRAWASIRRRRRSAQAYQSPLGKQSLTVGVSTCRWCSGAPAARTSKPRKADDQRVDDEQQDRAAMRSPRTRASRCCQLSAGAAQRPPRGEGGHGRGEAVRGRAKPLHHRQDQQHAISTTRRSRRTTSCSRTCRRCETTGRVLPSAPRDAVRFRDQAGTGR